MKDSEVGVFIVMAIAALSAYSSGTIDKLDALLCIISMTLIGELFACCAQTLEACRKKRDEWLKDISRGNQDK